MTKDTGSQAGREMREMNVVEHLTELRQRLVVSLTAIAVFSLAAYFFSELVFAFLCRPYFQAFPGGILIGTGPAEAFLLKLKIAAFCGVILAAPVIFYEFWLFVAPGLYESEKKMVMPFVLAATFLFTAGMFFCYRAVFPLAFRFFHEQYLSIGLTPTIRMSEHLSTMLMGLLSFGLIFEVPLLAFVLGRLGLINERTLISYGRYAVVAVFVLSAVLTPPDVVTQFLMAGPLLLLYGISIMLVRFTCRPAAQPSGSDNQKAVTVSKMPG